MSNTTKKFVAAFLTLVMVISVVTVNPVKAATTGTVTFVIEKLTIGQGLFIAPTQIQIEDGDTVQTVFNKVMELNSGSYTLKGNYVQSIDNADNGVVNIAQEIVLMPNIITSGTYYVDGEEHTYETAYYTPTNASHTGNVLKPSLGEGAYHEMSGWMFTINNESATTSFDQIKVKDGDVIRMQFSIYGWGADLGYDTESYTGIPRLQLQNKDALIKAVGEVNTRKAYWMAYPNVKAAYTNAVTVLSKFNPTAEEISSVLTTMQAAQKAPTYPAVAKATISKVQNVKGRKAKITVKKLTGVTGYQYMYSKKKNLKKATTVTTLKATIKTKKFKKVINKKTKKVKATTCYVKVRAYLKVNGVRVFGVWSAKKSVKIKK